MCIITQILNFCSGLISECYNNLYFSPGDVAGQFTPAPPTCPDNTFTFTCNVTGDINGFTLWRLDSGRIPASVCQLEHRSSSSGSFCGPGSLFTAQGGAGFGTDGPSYISTLSATASPRLNGMLVECFGPDGVNLEPYNLVGSGTVQIIGTLCSGIFLVNA